MRSLRTILRVAGVLAAFVAFSFTMSSSASAAAEHFCNQLLAPGNSCSSTYSDWDRVRTRYPGLQAHGTVGCVSMYYNGTTRNGQEYCAHTWNENPIGHNFGVTSSTWTSLNRLHYQQASGHTLVGWTSTNQTDG
jgi:hypothetical protein